MRKLILIAALLLPVMAGCQRRADVLNSLETGTQLTLTTHDGRTLSGRLTETRSDAIVVQPAGGAAVTIPRNQVATITISTPSQASPKEPGGTAGSAPAAGFAGQQAPAPVTGTPSTGPAEAADDGTPAAETRAEAPAPADRAANAPASEWREVTIPAGTRFTVRLDESLGSDTSRVEQPVRATVLGNVLVRGVTAVPSGSEVAGNVTQARRSGKVKGVAQLGLRFDSLTPKGERAHYPIRTGLVTRRAPTTHRKDALEIGAPAAGGAILGGILGGKKGALIGTTVGGGAGTAVVLSTRGKEVRLPRGTRLGIKLLEPVTVRVPA